MNNKHEAAFAKCVVNLRGSNPPEFDRFMVLLAERLEAITEQLVASPADQVFKNQGRAQEARDLFMAIEHGPKLAEQIRQKELTHGTSSA